MAGKGFAVECAFCLLEVPAGAAKCGHCQEYLSGASCPDCGVTTPAGARRCRCCRAELAAAAPEMVGVDLRVTAQLAPSILLRGRFLPQQVVADPSCLRVETPGTFGLSLESEVLPWGKVAGFNHRRGIIWDQVVIETRGQKPITIIGLSREDGARLRDLLERLRE